MLCVRQIMPMGGNRIKWTGTVKRACHKTLPMRSAYDATTLACSLV